MQNRKLDWRKIYKLIKEIIVVLVVFFLVILISLYFTVNKHNKIRKNIPENSPAVNAVVTYIKYFRFSSQYAEYSFNINGRTYTGVTFYGFDGNKGDSIYIEYNAANPKYNIYYDDIKPETVKKDVFFSSLEGIGYVVAFSIVFLPLYILFGFITGNKKTIAEVTSKK